ncbi:MAG: response regulator, partial [Sedimenticola sp.]
RIIRPVLALSGAERISGGDLEQEISVTARNEIGELAHSFNDMQFNLRENREKVAAQDWLKTGQAELNESMRGELDIGTLGRNIIDYLAEFLQIQLGALYLAEESGHLKMIGSHAYSQRKTVSNDFAPGEGLVGQAALERKPIVISNCPDDYITIRSGLGESVPRNILVFPLVMNEETKGVIELGSFEAFSEAQMEFLGVVGSSIAITLHAARARTRTVELLEQTQRQSRELQAQQEQLQAANEELQTQQEELKTTNEELEEQAQRLKASEESLQSQQEEMEVTNEELEEKNKLLERQSQEVEQAREEIEQKARELAQASKYKSEFLANMSHELRSPLNSLLLLAESLKNNPEGNLSPEQIESAGIIYGSGNDLLSLINEILDLSKIEAGRMDLNPELVRPTELANNARALFYHLAEEKGLKLEISVSETAPAQLTTDRQRVEQIIKNLVSNAIKFTEQGSVAISFGRPDAAANLQASGLTVDQTLAIAVKDSGIGVPPDKQQMIFQAFQQADGSTSRRYGGTGLGLSISSELAHMLGGEIQLESEPGTGSTFTLYLPLEVPVTDTEQPPPATQVEVISAEPQQDTPPATAKTMPDVVFPDDRESLQKGDDILLIIEDDPKFARILYQRAHEHRFHGVVALNGEEGIELARQLLPAAITLDLQLPGMDGWTVLSILKDAPDTRHIPVHIISVEESDIETRRRGAIGHLTKPASQADIEQVFQQFKELSRKQSKRLLVVEDDDTERRNLVGILDEDNAVIDEVTSGEEAWKALHEAQYDCVILDLGLGDMDGSELLRRLSAEAEVEIPPVIVYTARNLTHEEELELREYASSIILKDVRSQERLLDEVSLFLHSVVSELPEQKQRIITNLHDTDAVFRDRKVLVVDDDMRTVFAITRLLSAHGIKALKAENGLKALELLDREPDVELVLTDIMMPEMDGYETIARIREQDRFNKLPVIALTAKAMKEDRERCLTAGASDYLTKPLDQDRLLSMMRVWLSR